MSSDLPQLANSPPPVTIMSPPPSSSSNSSVTSLVQFPDALQQQEIDPQILEALGSKDRIYVLKLGEQMETLISDRTLTRQRIDLSPATSYQRMLVHRCAAYYGLSPETDPLTKAISVLITLESRIPVRRIADLAPPPAEAPLKFKIMMRNPRSQAGSVTGDDGEVSDVEASETGSLGGRSSASTSKHRRTIEERTAAYNEARSRIFVDWDDKDQKDTTSSASSSASLVSNSSASASGDDPGSPATESEWSGPSVKKQPPHRASSTSSSSSRSLRSSAPAFMSSNSSSSSRNSRAPSPASFKFPTLYEPPQNGISISVPPYDPAHAHAHSAPNFQAATPQQQQHPMQFYPYTAHPHMPQGQQQQQPYMAPYNPYYPQPYPYSHPSTPGSDPEVYAYNPYWGAPYPPQNGTPPTQNPSHGQTQNHGTAGGSPPPAQPYPGYMAPHGSTPTSAYAPYDATPTTASPPNGNPYAQPYYPAPPHHGHIPMPPYMAPPPPQPQTFEPRTNGRGGNANGRGRNGNINGSNGGGKGRGAVVAPPQRSAWSYGPGVSGGVNVDFPSTGATGYPPLMREAVGPRLSGSVGMGMGMRRGSSGNRTTSGSGSSTGDDVSSVASSSTTSSSSRRTYTSTTSSQQHHPLPARPDWAVGLRPNPTLHAPRHHDQGQIHSLTNSRTMSPISPPRALNGTSGHNSSGNSGNSSPHALSANLLRQQQLQQDHSQSPLHVHIQQQQHQHAAPAPPALTDFPPLTAPVPEKPRAPAVAGAWTNSSSTRSIVMAPAGQPNNVQAGGSALVTHHSGDKSAEAPPFQPKIVRRPTTGRSEASVNGTAGGGAAVTAGTSGKDKDRARGDAVASAILVSQVAGMTLEERGSADAPAVPVGVSASAQVPGMLPTKEPAALAVAI
ncbi:hypothetical protein C8R43DRAFT_936801 [Mycena crocata]|nr:hypothetical protein C8R43DRAFT_936801 [Mycena crocata]